MDEITLLKKQVKKYIDTADDKVVKMVHAMLEAATDNDWWNGMPENIKADMEVALNESAQGKTIPHETIKKRYQKWMPK